MLNAIRDLGDWAEDRFSSLCAAAGVTRNKSTQDRSGWDYIIQFTSTQIPGVPSDLLPGELSARIQVKSKVKGKPSVAIKLSNALRFTKEPSPCFVVLFQATNGAEPVRIYAKHFWQKEIENTLRRSRVADRDGRADLNKITLTISFGKEDEHTSDLVEWISNTVAATGGEHYAERKTSLVKNIGFEDGAFYGTIRFARDDLSSLVDHQIGLAPSAPVRHITLTNRRFGIDARAPIFQGTPDVAIFRVQPKHCRVRIRSVDAPDIRLDGNLFVPVGIPRELRKIRVVADFLDIVISESGESIAHLRFTDSEQRTLASLRALLDVASRTDFGPLHVQIDCGELPSLKASLAMPSIVDSSELKAFSNALACIEAATDGVLPSDFTLSFGEIYKARDAIVHFNGLVTGTGLQAQLELESTANRDLSRAASLYLYDYVDIGSWTILAVVRRPIEHLATLGENLEFNCGNPRVVESIVRRGTGAMFLPELQELYMQATKFEEGKVLSVFGGDYRAIVAGACTAQTVGLQ